MSLKENIIMMSAVLTLALSIYFILTFHLAFGLVLLVLSIINIHKSVK